jgi:hypothetical protein
MPSRQSQPRPERKLSVSLNGTDSEVLDAWALLMTMKPTHVVVSRGTAGPQQDRNGTDLTVRYNVLLWDK